MPLEIIRNDITNVAADAIVNTANPYPRIGSGTDSAIHTAAGPELLAARKQIGFIAPGGAAATPAFALPAKYVLHTVSPIWAGGQNREAEILRRAYDAALALADRLHCDSVAFPLMAAGNYGFPHDLALSIAIQAFTDFLMEHEITILLVLFSGKTFDLAGSLFDGLKSYIDDNYVEAKRKTEYGGAPPDYCRMDCTLGRRPPRKTDVSADQTFEASFVSCGNSVMPPVASSAGSLSDYLRRHEPTFSEALHDHLKEYSGKVSDVYKRAEVSKQLFSKILSNKDYQPTKSTAIQLAIGLQLDLPQTQKFLERAGYLLTRSSKADLVVQYYIERKIYSVTFINTALFDSNLPLLKTGLKA